MHGLIFAELKKYAETKHGKGSWHALLKTAGLETKTYLSVREYPDAEGVPLVVAVSSMSGPAGVTRIQSSCGIIFEDSGYKCTE